MDKKEQLGQEEYKIEVSKYKRLAPPVRPRRRPRSLRPCVVTRWGSTVAMVNGMLDMGEEIDEVCSMAEESVEKVSDDEWAQVKLACVRISLMI